MQAGKRVSHRKKPLLDGTSGLGCRALMQPPLFPTTTPPATRADALTQLRAFALRSHRYAKERNFVVADHTNVSRLSAAIQHRLISEREIIKTVLGFHPRSDVEKFIQEVLWRSYWKGWLEMRPFVWNDFLQKMSECSDAEIERAELVAAGKSGCAVMDEFARELIETGYLHNHARMWWSSFWIHQQRLPWQLGARHFMKHLLDADAASNTLSWRWVAGLHTAGKTYLVRRDNIERYHHAPAVGGRAMLENVRPHRTGGELLSEKIPYQSRATVLPSLSAPTALLIHEEDLSLETSVLRDAMPQSIGFFLRCDKDMSAPRTAWRHAAFSDAIARASHHFQKPIVPLHSASEIIEWLQRNHIRNLLMMAPMIGPLHDALVGMTEQLQRTGIRLTTLRREEDERLFPLACSGFFTFWKKASRFVEE